MDVVLQASYVGETRLRHDAAPGAAGGALQRGVFQNWALSSGGNPEWKGVTQAHSRNSCAIDARLGRQDVRRLLGRQVGGRETGGECRGQRVSFEQVLRHDMD